MGVRYGTALLGAALGLALGGVRVGAQASDTLGAVRSIQESLADHYHVQGRPDGLSREERGNVLGWVCDADEGRRDCWDDEQFMPYLAQLRSDCCSLSDPIFDEMAAAAAEHPSSGFLIGQAVYGLLRAGRHLEAMQLAQGCKAEGWWCAGVELLVYDAVGRAEAAVESARRFLDQVPDDVACELVDATWLLGSYSSRAELTISYPGFRRVWREESCTRRHSASDSIYWLSDPLYVVEGNDRKAVDLARSIQDRLRVEISTLSHGSYSPDSRAITRARHVRRGTRDSWEFPSNPMRNDLLCPCWTSKKAARYHFVPDFEGEGFGKPSWRLMADFEDEGYTPPYAPFYELPLQLARFRASADTMQRVATAGLVTGSDIEAAAESGYLVFTDAPESFPLQLEAPLREGRAVYLAEAETKPHAVSFEVLTSAGIGWHREWVEPLGTEGPGLSDVLLYRPTGMAEPDSLLVAAALMHGTTSLEPAELGLYWEPYDVSAETPVEFALEARKADGGGLIDSLRRLLPGGGADEGSGQLAWTEPSTGAVHPRAIILDLRNLDEGEYDLVLRARWDGGEAESTRRIAVSPPR